MRTSTTLNTFKNRLSSVVLKNLNIQNIPYVFMKNLVEINKSLNFKEKENSFNGKNKNWEESSLLNKNFGKENAFVLGNYEYDLGGHNLNKDFVFFKSQKIKVVWKIILTLN